MKISAETNRLFKHAKKIFYAQKGSIDFIARWLKLNGATESRDVLRKFIKKNKGKKVIKKKVVLKKNEPLPWNIVARNFMEAWLKHFKKQGWKMNVESITKSKNIDHVVSILKYRGANESRSLLRAIVKTWMGK